MLTTFRVGFNGLGGVGIGGSETVDVNYPQLQIRFDMATMVSRSTNGFILMTAFFSVHMATPQAVCLHR